MVISFFIHSKIKAEYSLYSKGGKILPAFNLSFCIL